MGLRVAILTEGGRSGLGHLARCSSLCDGFLEIGVSSRFFLPAPEAAGGFLSGRDMVVCDWVSHPERVLDAVAEFDFVIVDSYNASALLLQELSAHRGLRVFFDDFHRKDYPAGIIINAALNADASAYPCLVDEHRLLGPGFAMLRREFREEPPPRPFAGSVRRILVTTGGQDSLSVMPRLIGALSADFPALEKIVVIGPAFENLEQIRNAADGNTTFSVAPDGGALRAAMLECDLAISAAGQTLYELARLGVPTIAFAVAENQLPNRDGFERIGFSLSLSSFDGDALRRELRAQIGKLQPEAERMARSSAGRALIDGSGARRAAEACLGVFVQRHLEIRLVRSSDCEALHRLTSQPAIRESSFNRDSIPFPSHAAWFDRTLADRQIVFLAADALGKIAGQLRLKIEDAHRAVVSISVDESFKKMGVGRKLIERGVAELQSRFPGISELAALVRAENAGSLKFFESLEFRRVGERTIEGQPAFEYRRVLGGGK